MTRRLRLTLLPGESPQEHGYRCGLLGARAHRIDWEDDLRVGWRGHGAFMGGLRKGRAARKRRPSPVEMRSKTHWRVMALPRLKALRQAVHEARYEMPRSLDGHDWADIWQDFGRRLQDPGPAAGGAGAGIAALWAAAVRDWTDKRPYEVASRVYEVARRDALARIGA